MRNTEVDGQIHIDKDRVASRTTLGLGIESEDLLGHDVRNCVPSRPTPCRSWLQESALVGTELLPKHVAARRHLD